MKANIIGCGPSGITAAVLLKERGYDVEIFEAREHIAGNCYDEKQDGITVHKYGAHIFHTRDKEVWDFVTRYSKFNDYQHKVRANTSLGLISIPYNNTTTQQLGRELSPKEIQDLIFRQYSERHWGIPWEKLPKSISGRVPTKRESDDQRYFLDECQGIPVDGYTALFGAMLEGIPVNLGVSKKEYRNLKGDLTVYTGKIDEFFDYEYGELSYRSLRFEHFKAKRDPLFSFDQGAVINECNDKPYNRTGDNSIYLNERSNDYTVFTRDYPCAYDKSNEPIYPMNFGKDAELYKKYRSAAGSRNDVIFLGRLATYKYLDMWMAIKQVMVKIA